MLTTLEIKKKNLGHQHTQILTSESEKKVAGKR